MDEDQMRFSLSTLLLITALIAMGLGWMWDHKRISAKYQANTDSLKAALKEVDYIQSQGRPVLTTLSTKYQVESTMDDRDIFSYHHFKYILEPTDERMQTLARIEIK